MPKNFGKYWFWVAFPTGLILGFTVNVWLGILAFWVLSIAPHLIFFLYRRMAKQSEP